MPLHLYKRRLEAEMTHLSAPQLSPADFVGVRIGFLNYPGYSTLAQNELPFGVIC